MTRATVRIATALLLLLPTTAEAQQLKLSGHAALASGLEAGDPGTGETTFRRARTRLVLGVDGRVDEDLTNGFGVVLFTEIEPNISVGGELRYMRWLSKRVVGFVGGTGAFAPHTLLGGCFGVQLRIPFDSTSSLAGFIEPSFSVVPLGTDLPSDRALIWGLLSLGIHANL